MTKTIESRLAALRFDLKQWNAQYVEELNNFAEYALVMAEDAATRSPKENATIGMSATWTRDYQARADGLIAQMSEVIDSIYQSPDRSRQRTRRTQRRITRPKPGAASRSRGWSPA